MTLSFMTSKISKTFHKFVTKKNCAVSQNCIPRSKALETFEMQKKK